MRFQAAQVSFDRFGAAGRDGGCRVKVVLSQLTARSVWSVCSLLPLLMRDNSNRSCAADCRVIRIVVRSQSGSKLHALHTLRVIRCECAEWGADMLKTRPVAR